MDEDLVLHPILLFLFFICRLYPAYLYYFIHYSPYSDNLDEIFYKDKANYMHKRMWVPAYFLHKDRVKQFYTLL